MNRIFDIYNQGALSTRAYNILVRSGFSTIEDLKAIDYKYLIDLKGCTHKIALEILNLLVAKHKNLSTILEDKNIIDKEIADILKLNKICNNRKVTLMVRLAQDKASTLGEKLNCINKCKMILAKQI